MTFELRKYQTDAVNAVISDMKTNQKVGIIMPTGSGKTEVFIKIAETFLQNNPKESVLILSHLSLLTYQTAERFKLRAPDLKIGTFQADQSPPVDAQIIIGTMQTSSSDKKTDKLKLRMIKSIGLIIIDEAHYLTCSSYKSALGSFPQALQVGCTATPFRSGALMTNYFDKISYSISIKELISQGHLVNPSLIEVTDNSTEVSDKIALIASIYKAKELGKSAIIFMKSIEDSKTMRNVLDNDGIKASAVTSEMGEDEREPILKAFREGKIQVLTTVNVLTAGFDSKNIEAIFMPYATKSPTTYLQRIGRGLRPDPTINKTECRIYVCGDSPSIKRELYKKLHDNVLLINSRTKKSTTFEEDYEYAEEKTDQIYIWSGHVVDTIKKLRELKMDKHADLLNKKKFPKRFLNDIVTFCKGLTKQAIDPTSEPASPSKIAMLKSLGYTVNTLTEITSSEASNLIAAALNVKEKWKTEPFVVTSGKFAGTHASKLSKPYIMTVKSRFPFSQIAKMINEYEQSGGKYIHSKSTI